MTTTHRSGPRNQASRLHILLTQFFHPLKQPGLGKQNLCAFDSSAIPLFSAPVACPSSWGIMRKPLGAEKERPPRQWQIQKGRAFPELSNIGQRQKEYNGEGNGGHPHLEPTITRRAAPLWPAERDSFEGEMLALQLRHPANVAMVRHRQQPAARSGNCKVKGPADDSSGDVRRAVGSKSFVLRRDEELLSDFEFC